MAFNSLGSLRFILSYKTPTLTITKSFKTDFFKSLGLSLWSVSFHPVLLQLQCVLEYWNKFQIFQLSYFFIKIASQLFCYFFDSHRENWFYFYLYYYLCLYCYLLTNDCCLLCETFNHLKKSIFHKYMQIYFYILQMYSVKIFQKHLNKQPKCE